MIDDLLAEAREALKTVSSLTNEYALQVWDLDYGWCFLDTVGVPLEYSCQATWRNNHKEADLSRAYWPGRATRIVRRQVTQWEVVE